MKRAKTSRNAAAGRIGPFLAALASDNPRRLAWVLTVQVITALTQGAGLLLLVPLLEVTGVSRGSAAGGLASRAREAFGALGIPLTLGAMLAVYIAVVAFTAALSAYQSVLLVRYRLEFVDKLRRRLYGTIARAEWRHLLGLRQSDLLTALTVDIGWVGQGTLAVLNLGVAAIVVTVQVAVASADLDGGHRPGHGDRDRPRGAGVAARRAQSPPRPGAGAAQPGRARLGDRVPGRPQARQGPRA